MAEALSRVVSDPHRCLNYEFAMDRHAEAEFIECSQCSVLVHIRSQEAGRYEIDLTPVFRFATLLICDPTGPRVPANLPSWRPTRTLSVLPPIYPFR